MTTAPRFILKDLLGLALVALLVASGCGGEPLGTSTDPIASGTRVSPQRYLADSVAAAEAVGDFSALLGELPSQARPRDLTALAPRLDAALGRAAAIAGRLQSARLEDRRLEDQRARAAGVLSDVVGAMGDVTAAAQAGDPVAAAAASRTYATAVGALRSLPDGP